MKHKLIILILLIAVACVGYTKGRMDANNCRDATEAALSRRTGGAVLFVPTIKEIQVLVGAEPDGQLGPETQRLWERALHNQMAAKYMTETGEPNELQIL